VVLLLESVRKAPLGGAAPLRVTVAVDVPPAVTAGGFSATLTSAAGLIVSLPTLTTLFAVALISATVCVATAVVVTGKVTLVASSGTATVGGTVAAGLVLESATVTPPTGAAPVKATVPSDGCPPMRALGLSDTDEGAGAVTVRSLETDLPLKEAVIFAVAFAATGVVVTWKPAVSWPCRIVTLGGVVAAGLLLLRFTTVSAVAGLISSTIPAELTPPGTLAGLSRTVRSVAADCPCAGTLVRRTAAVNAKAIKRRMRCVRGAMGVVGMAESFSACAARSRATPPDV
jgi:hypothetical protein